MSITSITPTDIITIITVIGALLYTIIKYTDKKSADPATKFDLTYAMALIAAMYGASYIVQSMNLDLSIMGIITAFYIGFSFSAGASAINTKIPIKLEV